jgi:hypothetical protein
VLAEQLACELARSEIVLLDQHLVGRQVLDADEDLLCAVDYEIAAWIIWVLSFLDKLFSEKAA